MTPMESIAATRPKPPRQTHGLPWLGAGALFGAIAVGAGAYGSHALRAELAEPLLVMYETAVRYQMYHALALLAVGALGHVLSRRALTLAAGTTTALVGASGARESACPRKGT